MYAKILRQMRKAARAGHVNFRSHAFDEMSNDDLEPADAINCMLTGEIIEDQFDADYQQTKYVIYGGALNEDEIGVVAVLDIGGRVGVITVFRLTVEDYA